VDGGGGGVIVERGVGGMIEGRGGGVSMGVLALG
jgi:hypothetical protein